jgi:hypothetical protein
MPAQPPAQNISVSVTTTTTVASSQPLQPLFSWLPGLDQWWIYLVAIVGAVIAIAVVLLATKLMGHPLARNISNWLASPTTDALAIALDPDTKTMTLMPVKRVGSMYVSTERPVFVLPVQGGEVYLWQEASKPVLVTIRYGRYSTEWLPSLEQVVSLSVMPITLSEAPPTDAGKLEEEILSRLVQEQARLAGEVYIGPNMKLYISASVPEALRLLKFYVNEATYRIVNAGLSAIARVEEEGAKLMEMRIRQELAARFGKWMPIVFLILIVVVAIVMLKIFHVL